MADQRKKPSFRQIQEEAKRQPRLEANPESFHRRNPSWRVGKMEFVDPFGWHVLNGEMLNYVRSKLSDLETRTWGEILNSRHNHNVDVSRICKDARDRLEEMRQYDLEEILSLRLSGAERVWGILSEGVCTVLWWDPEHQVCPSLRD